jgi:hypothetical protein
MYTFGGLIMTGQEGPLIKDKPWFKKWWIWLLIAIGVLFIAALVSPSSEEDAAQGDTTTTAGATDSTTTTVATDSTTTTGATESTTTTEATAILAEGSGRGDDVVELDIPAVAVMVELSHAGTSNFVVWSLDVGFDNVDLLVNTIGHYDGTRPMQWDSDDMITGLEISADGDWTYQIRPLLQEPQQSCPMNGSSDAVILLTDFDDTGGAADLTHDGDANFAVWAWGTSGTDLLVNEIGAYEGTVRVSAGLFAWDITANGNWTVDC